MRILQLADFYPPVIGGTERHTQRLAEELSRRGHHSVVATLSVPDAPAHEVGAFGEVVHRIDSGWIEKAIPYNGPTRQAHPPFPDPGITRALNRIVDAEQPDVIYGHNWMLYSYLSGKRNPAAYVVDVLHDYGLVCTNRTLLRSDGATCQHDGSLRQLCDCGIDSRGRLQGIVAGAGLYYSTRRLHQRVDQYFAVSQAVAEASAPGLAGRPVTVVPSFIASDLRQIGDSEPRPDFLPAEPYLLFVGSLTEWKGVTVLADAYRQLLGSAPPLVVIGTPRSGVQVDWPADVHVFRDVPHAQVMAAWKHCLFGVVPSVWAEAFGQVAAEALTMGKAVIASDTGGLRDVVRDGFSGLLVPANDAPALSAAMARLINEPELCRQLGRNAESDAKRFTVAAVADQIEGILLPIVAGRRPRDGRTS